MKVKVFITGPTLSEMVGIYTKMSKLMSIWLPKKSCFPKGFEESIHLAILLVTFVGWCLPNSCAKFFVLRFRRCISRFFPHVPTTYGHFCYFGTFSARLSQTVNPNHSTPVVPAGLENPLPFRWRFGGSGGAKHRFGSQFRGLHRGKSEGAKGQGWTHDLGAVGFSEKKW